MNVHQTPFFPTENSKANSGHNSLNIEKDDLNPRQEYPRSTSESINFILNGEKSVGRHKPFKSVKLIENTSYGIGASTSSLE